METGEEKWNFYNAYNHEFPSEEDMKTLKAVIIPGSSRSSYDNTTTWIPLVKDFIRTVLNEYPDIKLIGGCFGEQTIAATMGGKAEKMPYNAERPNIIGRELIQPTDEFYSQSWVQSFMTKNNYTMENFPKIVLQQSHGDHVSELPTGATLLASSESCGVEFYCIGERALCFQSHPDFNCGMQLEFNEPEYFISGSITEEWHKKSY